MNKLALAAVLLTAPLAARADVGLRVGLGADIANHAGGWTHVITDNWPLEGQVMLSYWIPTSLLAIDLEVAEGFYLKAPDCAPASCGTRLGTVLRPGIRLSPPILPIYGRAIFAVANVLHKNGDKTLFAYGAAAGLKFGLGPVGVFAAATGVNLVVGLALAALLFTGFVPAAQG